jgi:hypothetical protein
MRSKTLKRLVLLLAMVLLAATAHAQPKKGATVRDALPAAAVGAWDDGLLLLKLQTPDYEKALIKFREAYEASKNPRVLFNVAVCERNLNRYARAAATLRRQLSEGEGTLPAGEVDAAKAAIAALERFVSTLEIVVTEPEATIAIDGEKVGTSPLLAPVSVDIGSRTVTVQKSGFVDVTRSVAVSSGTPAKETFALEPLQKKAMVTVRVDGAKGALVKMDGVVLGSAPFTGEVSAGRHTFTAEAEGFVTATQTSEVRHKEPLAITMSLAKKIAEGRLEVNASPAGAIIEVDGKVVGSTRWEGLLASGAHQVVVRRDGYQPASLEILVTDGARLTRRLTLVEAASTGWIGWAIGTAVVVGGGVVAGYFLFKPSDEQPIPGSLRQDVGTPVPAFHRF